MNSAEANNSFADPPPAHILRSSRMKRLIVQGKAVEHWCSQTAWHASTQARRLQAQGADCEPRKHMEDGPNSA